MRINVITNLDAGKGLARDFAVLRDVLAPDGHEVRGLQFNRSPPGGAAADLNIFLERTPTEFLRLAPRHWLVPNPEWTQPDDLASIVRVFELVWCKTAAAMDLVKPLAPQAECLGWASADHLDVGIRRRRSFLHVFGTSREKGTLAVLEAWRRPEVARHDLTIVGGTHVTAPPGVRHLTDVGGADMHRLQNEHLYHLCPSRCEGWGHTIHEALGCGAVILTTAAAPMSDGEAPRELLIPPVRRGRRGLAETAEVDADGVAAAVERAVALDDVRLLEIARAARTQFEGECEAFRKSVRHLVGGAS